MPTVSQSEAVHTEAEEYEEEEAEESGRSGRPPPSYPPPPRHGAKSSAHASGMAQLLAILHQKEDVIDGLAQQLVESQEESDRLSQSLRQLLQEREHRGEKSDNDRKEPQKKKKNTSQGKDEKEGEKTKRNPTKEKVVVERLEKGERYATQKEEDASGMTPRTFSFLRQRWETERDGLMETVAGQERKIARLQFQLQQASDEASKREEVIAQLQHEVNSSFVEWENDRRGATETAHLVATFQAKLQHLEEEKEALRSRWREEKAAWVAKERRLKHRWKAAERNHQKEWSALHDEVTQLTSETQEERVLQQMESDRRVTELEASVQERTMQLHTVEQKLALLQQQHTETERMWAEAKEEEKVQQRERQAQATRQDAERFRLQMDLQQSQASLRVSEQKLHEMTQTLSSSATTLQELREELHRKEEEQQRLREATVERVEAFLRDEETVKDGMLSQVDCWVKNREEMSHVVAAAEEKRRRAEEKAIFFQDLNDSLRQTAQEQSTRAAEDILEQHRWAAGVMTQLQEQQQVLLRRWQQEEAKGVDLLSTVEVLTRIGEEQRERQVRLEQEALESKECWKESLTAQWKTLKKNKQLIRTLRLYQQKEKFLTRRLRGWQSDCWGMAKTIATALGLSTSTSAVPPLVPLWEEGSLSSPLWQDKEDSHTFLFTHPMKHPNETSEESTTDVDTSAEDGDDEEETEEDEETKIKIKREKESGGKKVRLHPSGASPDAVVSSRLLQQTVSTTNKRVARFSAPGGPTGRLLTPSRPRRAWNVCGTILRGRRKEVSKMDQVGKEEAQTRHPAWEGTTTRGGPPRAAPSTSRPSPHTLPPMVACMQHVLAFTVPHLGKLCQQFHACEKQASTLAACVQQKKEEHSKMVHRLHHLRCTHEKEIAALQHHYRLHEQQTYRQWWGILWRAYTTHWLAIFRGVPLLLSHVLLAVAGRLHIEEAAAAAEVDAGCGGAPATRGGGEGGARTDRPAPAVQHAAPSPPPPPVAEWRVSDEIQRECDGVLKEIWGVEGGWHSLTTAVSSPSPSVEEKPRQDTARPSPLSASSPFSASSFIRRVVTSSLLSFHWSPTQWKEMTQFVHAALLRQMRPPWHTHSSSSSAASLSSSRRRAATTHRPAPLHSSMGYWEVPMDLSLLSIPTTTPPPEEERRDRKSAGVRDVHHHAKQTNTSSSAVRSTPFVTSISTSSSCPVIDIDMEVEEEEEEEKVEREDNGGRSPTASHLKEIKATRLDGKGMEAEDSSSLSALVPPFENVPVLPSFLHPLLSAAVGDGANSTVSPFAPFSAAKSPSSKKGKATDKTKRKTCRTEETTKKENYHENTNTFRDPAQEGELFVLLYRVMYHVVHDVFLDRPL